jgi:hypothetical protein
MIPLFNDFFSKKEKIALDGLNLGNILILGTFTSQKDF